MRARSASGISGRGRFGCVAMVEAHLCSALRYVAGLLEAGEHEMDLIPAAGDPKDLFGEVLGNPDLLGGSPPLSKAEEVSRVA